MSAIDFFTGALAVCSVLLLWFGSPLKISLGKLFFKENFLTHAEFDDYLFIKNRLLGKLLSCWICLSFWLSLAIGVFFVLVCGAHLYTPILTFFIYPSICYVFKIITKL